MPVDTVLTINEWQFTETYPVSSWVSLCQDIGFTAVSLGVRLSAIDTTQNKFVFNTFKSRAQQFKNAGIKVLLRLVADGPGLINRYWDQYNTGTVTVSGTSVTGTGTAWSSAGIKAGQQIAFDNNNPIYASPWYTIQSVNSDTSITLTSSAPSKTNVQYVISSKSQDHLFSYLFKEVQHNSTINSTKGEELKYALKDDYSVYALNIYNPECQAMFEQFIRDCWTDLSDTGNPKDYVDWLSFSWGISWETDAMLREPPSGKKFPWRNDASRSRTASVLRSILANFNRVAKPFTDRGVWCGAQFGSLWHIPHWRLGWRRPANETALHLADITLPDVWYGTLGSTNANMYNVVACFSCDLARGLGLKWVVNEYDTHTSRSNYNTMSTLAILNSADHYPTANLRMVNSAKRAIERGINWQIMHWEYNELNHTNGKPALQEICQYAQQYSNSITTLPPITVSGNIRQIFDMWRAAVGINDYSTVPNVSVPVVIKNLHYTIT